MSLQGDLRRKIKQSRIPKHTTSLFFQHSIACLRRKDLENPYKLEQSASPFNTHPASTSRSPATRWAPRETSNARRSLPDILLGNQLTAPLLALPISGTETALLTPSKSSNPPKPDVSAERLRKTNAPHTCQGKGPLRQFQNELNIAQFYATQDGFLLLIHASVAL